MINLKFHYFTILQENWEILINEETSRLIEFSPNYNEYLLPNLESTLFSEPFKQVQRSDFDGWIDNLRKLFYSFLRLLLLFYVWVIGFMLKTHKWTKKGSRKNINFHEVNEKIMKKSIMKGCLCCPSVSFFCCAKKKREVFCVIFSMGRNLHYCIWNGEKEDLRMHNHFSEGRLLSADYNLKIEKNLLYHFIFSKFQFNTLQSFTFINRTVFGKFSNKSIRNCIKNRI